MSDERPSIAKLQKLERAMVRGPWTKSQTENAALNGGPAGSAQVRCDAASDVVPSGCLIPYFILHAADAEGIAELRNAAKVLLEIAAAALTWLDADDSWSSEASDGEVAEKHAALKTALAKVRL